MSNPDVKRLLQVKNEHCILVAFVNEKDNKDQNLIDTGYSCWLQAEDQKNIKNVIKNEKQVAIQWPKCEIKCAKSMKKLRDIEFQKSVVTILAYGGKLYLTYMSLYFFYVYV